MATKQVDFEKKSKRVLEAMCEIVGTSQIVARRREIMDINELLCSCTMAGSKLSQILAGSYREGFRFKQSDMDLRFCLEDFKVIWNSSQFSNQAKHILADGSMSPPGYCFLQILSTRNTIFMLCIVIINGKKFICGSALIAFICSFSPRFQKHGPCALFTNEVISIDDAICLKSDYWPYFASSFVERCNLKLWPKPDLIEDIIKSGCHVVPVGSKSGDNEDLEWRISFSVAERKLVNDMSHFQFLLYGLLKLFLNEVINNCCEEDKLLSSYHIKTAVFWTLHDNLIPECCPRNFLKYFWICLKMLIKWVDKGNCPNFFIPENNMFRYKIYGSLQQKLLQKLMKLYQDGPLCVLKCPSIKKYSSSTLTYNISIYGKQTQPLLIELFDVFEEFTIPSLWLNKLVYWLEPLKIIEQLLDSNVSEIKALVLRRATNNVLENIAFILLSLSSGKNRSFYVMDKIACQVLKLSAKFGNASDMLIRAMYYYTTFRFKKALSFLNLAKELLHEIRPGFIKSGIDRCAWKMRDQLFFALAERKSLIKLYNAVFYINELKKEQECAIKLLSARLFIPPYVLLHMLEFLCQRHVDEKKAQAALDDLTDLVNCDEGKYRRNISWQILGICQELSGNLQGALYAYKKSLTCNHALNQIRSASEERIQNVENLLQRNKATIS